VRIILQFILFFSLELSALEITLSKGLQNSSTYSVLEIVNDDAFSCKAQLDSFGTQKELICFFDKVPKESLKPLENEFFTITFKKLKKEFFLIINAKHKLYFHPVIFDLAKDDEIFSPVTSTAKEWVVVGYDKKLPMIEKTQKNSLHHYTNHFYSKRLQSSLRFLEYFH